MQFLMDLGAICSSSFRRVCNQWRIQDFIKRAKFSPPLPSPLEVVISDLKDRAEFVGVKEM